MQPADRRCRLWPDISNLEQPGATGPAREQGSEGGHREWWRGDEHRVGAWQRDRARCSGGDESGVIRDPGAARTVDAARRPNPMMRDALDRLAAERELSVRGR